MSVIALARKAGFSSPVVTILAKGPEKITRENEFELFGKWFSMILRCSLCSLTHNPISPIVPVLKSEFLSLLIAIHGFICQSVQHHAGYTIALRGRRCESFLLWQFLS